MRRGDICPWCLRVVHTIIYVHNTIYTVCDRVKVFLWCSFLGVGVSTVIVFCFRIHFVFTEVFSLVDAESITAEELRGLSDAVSSLRPKKVLNEELEELKEDREEYRHVRSLVPRPSHLHSTVGWWGRG